MEYSNYLHKLTIVDYDNTDATTKHIQQHLTTILDKNTPLRTTKVHLKSTNAWWNNELSELLRIIRKKLENYFNYNYLKFNLQNTGCIIFHSKSHTTSPITHIKIANKDIPIKTTITILGVICNYKIFKIK